MANSVPFRTTPQLGPQLNEVFAGLPYWDLIGVQGATPLLPPVSGVSSPSYKLGNVETGSDGGSYMWVRVNGAIAASGAGATGLGVTLDPLTYNITTGGTDAYIKPNTRALVAGDFLHVRLGYAYNAVPK